MAVTAAPTLPTVFGRYVLLRRLSRGGMGEIFLAKSGQLSGFEKLCVIKKVLPNLAADHEFIARFIDEAKVAIKLSHANIAAVYEVGKVDGDYFLALEYLEGRDVRRAINRLADRGTRMPTELALLVVRDVANGLAYAHRRTDETGRPLHVVHCDVSPPNVIVSFEGEVKLIDFGIAKSALRLTGTNPNVGFGKFGYMAPEQLVRGGVVDRRTDVYAAGVLLYELLTGERMFTFPAGADYRAMARMVVAGQHPRPSDRVPALADLDELVLRAVAPEPNARYPHAEDFRDALQGALAGRSPTLTNDRLGAFLRELFAEEVVEERAFARQASAVDLTPYFGELTEGHTVTVSFARNAPPPLPPPPPPAPAETTAILGDGSPWRRRVVPALVAAAASAGLVGALLLLRRPPRPVAPAPTVQPLPAPPAAAAPGAGTPGARAAETPSAAAGPPPSEAAEPADRAGASSRASAEPRAAPAPSGPTRAAPERRPSRRPPETPVTAAMVQAKYKAVAREYARFKRAYGARLEAEWNDVLTFATYGSGEGKQARLNAKLDAFRRRIAAARKGR